MENLTTAISVQVDAKDKEIASSILKNLGLNMSTYVNMAIKQLINKDGVPFEVVNPKQKDNLFKYFTKEELEETAKELAYMENHLDEYKGYHNVHQMFEDILNED